MWCPKFHIRPSDDWKQYDIKFFALVFNDDSQTLQEKLSVTCKNSTNDLYV